MRDAPDDDAPDEAAFRRNLELFEPYWSAQPNKTVLAVKWAPIWPGPVYGDWLLGKATGPKEPIELEELETGNFDELGHELP